MPDESAIKEMIRDLEEQRDQIVVEANAAISTLQRAIDRWRAKLPQAPQPGEGVPAPGPGPGSE